jgi:hypothetical protein
MSSEHLPTRPPNSEQESPSRQPPQVFGPGTQSFSALTWESTPNPPTRSSKPTPHLPPCYKITYTTTVTNALGGVTLETRFIWIAFIEKRAMPEFQGDLIPPLVKHTHVHDQLREFLRLRVNTEMELKDMLSDRATDGSPLDPHRDYQDEYHRLNQQCDDINNAMYTVYATFLDKTPLSERKIAPPSLLMLLPR